MTRSGQRSPRWRSSRVVVAAVVVLLSSAVAGASPAAAGVDGTLSAWGDNQYGQLGNGGVGATFCDINVGCVHPSADSPLPAPVPALAPTSVVAVAAGHFHSLAATAEGNVWAWGLNYFGQLGNGTTPDGGAIPVPAPVAGPGGAGLLTGVTALAAGQNHSLALKADGTLWAWGGNYAGQLGNGTTTGSKVPVQVSSLTGVTAIAAGANHNLALTADGTVWAWGQNAVGQLAQPSSVSRLTTPTAIDNLTATAVAAGFHHSLALEPDGTVASWGWNAYGQLGDGTLAARSKPGRVSSLTNVTAISAGHITSQAATSDGSAWAWGSNGTGELGNGSIGGHSTRPVQVSGLTNIVATAGGRAHAMALDASGAVWAWGDNSHGQLGDGTIFDSAVPRRAVDARRQRARRRGTPQHGDRPRTLEVERRSETWPRIRPGSQR